VSYARVCRDRGQTLGDISRRLGLVESTLARWLRAAKVEATDLAPAFRSVSLAGDEVAAYRGEVEPSLRLVTPRGYRVEGLDVATLAYLLQVVG
jgi:transposase-like protein